MPRGYRMATFLAVSGAQGMERAASTLRLVDVGSLGPGMVGANNHHQFVVAPVQPLQGL